MIHKCTSIGLLNIYLYYRASLYLYEIFLFNNINILLYCVRYSWIYTYEYDEYSEFWAVVFIFINMFCWKYLYDTVRNITCTINRSTMRYLAYDFFLIENIASTSILLIIPIVLTYLIYLWGSKTSVKYYILSIARLSQCR